jgi:hypothetical protein
MPKASNKPDAVEALDFLLERIVTTGQIVDAELAAIEKASGAGQRGDHHVSEAVDRKRQGYLRACRNALADFCITAQQAKLARQLDI